MGFGGFEGSRVEDGRDVQVLGGDAGNFSSPGISLHLNCGRDPTYIWLFMEPEEYEKSLGMRPVHMVRHAGDRTYPGKQANKVVGAGYIATTSRQAKMWLAWL